MGGRLRRGMWVVPLRSASWGSVAGRGGRVAKMLWSLAGEESVSSRVMRWGCSF